MAGSLILDHVDKFYGPKSAGIHAVKDFSMAVEDGEIVALLGSSGCGKTTMLRMIAGFETVTEGEMRLNERRIQDIPPAKRNVAMAFEGYSLYPPLTVRDNIAFALKGARLQRSEIDKRVDEMAELLEIGPILNRYPVSLSGGQQQRASLARALTRKADLYLLDEPMSQLEPQLRAVLRGRIKNFLIQHGMTAMFVTHDQTEANALADRIAVMEDGVLEQIASPAELKDRPANLFVASFMGEPPMNVYEAAVEQNGGGMRVVVRGPDGQEAIGVNIPAGSADVQGALSIGQKLHMGVRPQSIALGQGDDRALVLSNQWLGDQTHLVIDAGGHQMVIVSYTPVKEKTGETIPFLIAPEKIHLFNFDNGDAIAHGIELAK
jgi:multiple sugar transport system ATP-binding protein